MRYVEATLEDIALANQLAHEVLGRTLDELPPQTRRLLALLVSMVERECAQQHISRAQYRFSRRAVRESTRWGDTQLKIHLARLIELEYLLVHRGGRGQSFEYELLYDGAGSGDAAHVSGLIDVEALRACLRCRAVGVRRPAVGPWSGRGRRVVGGWSGAGDRMLTRRKQAFTHRAHNGAENAHPRPRESAHRTYRRRLVSRAHETAQETQSLEPRARSVSGRTQRLLSLPGALPGGFAARGHSPHTLQLRRDALRGFIRWADERGISRPQEVTRPILERYRRYLYHYRKDNGEPLSFATQAQRLIPLRASSSISRARTTSSLTRPRSLSCRACIGGFRLISSSPMRSSA